MQKKIVERYFFFSLLILTVVFVISIFGPFLAEMVVGASLAVVLYPLYEGLRNIKLPNWLAALIVVLGFTISLGVPLYLLGTVVFTQSQDVYHSVITGEKTSALVDGLSSALRGALPVGTTIDLRDKALDIVSFLSNNIAKVFTYTLSTMLSILLMFLVLYYCLKDGKGWIASLISLSPLPDTDDKKILLMLRNAVNGVMKGYLLIGIVQGILMGCGLALFGVPDPALWGVVAAVASLIPTVGTAIISVPAILYLFATGNAASAVGLLAWAVVIVGTIDNILNPIVVGKNVNVPPILILLSVLGGIALLGPVGILVGPLAVSLLHTLLTIYQDGISLKSLKS